MNPAGPPRRLRRTWLLLSTILVPTALVGLLVVRVVGQENELAERRSSEERHDALDQLRRELSARLQAVRLEEVNRLIGESGTRLPPDSPIVFVAPIGQDHMVLPWDDDRPAASASARFTQHIAEGEALEFQRHDASAAAAAYRRVLSEAASMSEVCAARVALGRSHIEANEMAAAEQIDLQTLRECGDVSDGDGIPFALYAAERLFDRQDQAFAAAQYVENRVAIRQWHSPGEAYALQSLLRRMSGAAAVPALRAISQEIRNIEQAAALARDLHDDPGKLQRAARTAPGDLAWLGYGDEPWLVTLVSPASFAAPVVIAVSSRRVVPAGITLHAAPSAAAASLGDGFVNLYASWPAGRFARQPAVPPVVYGSMLLVLLVAVSLTGYLVVRDVQREADTAALQSHFVASVSHELRTPLASIRAHAETLLLGRASGRQTTSDYLKTIVSESERLSRLVDSVLEFSRIEQGRKTYQMHPTSLDEVVRAAARTMEYPLAQFGFTLDIRCDDTNPTVLGDPEALTQAILNLLSNAMKYSADARRIEMRTGSRGREAFVDVTDDGIGIARDEHGRIFERFHRVRSPETEGIAGAGLGLALALHVVEAHRGRIGVVSDVGRGSTFSISIPLQESMDGVSHTRPAAGLSPPGVRDRNVSRPRTLPVDAGR